MDIGINYKPTKTQYLDLEYDEAYLDRNTGDVGMAQWWSVQYETWLGKREPWEFDFGVDLVMVKKINEKWVEV